MRYLAVALLLLAFPAAADNYASCSKTAESLDRFYYQIDVLYQNGKSAEAERLKNNIQRDVQNFVSACLQDCPKVLPVLQSREFAAGAADFSAYRQIYQKRRELCPPPSVWGVVSADDAGGYYVDKSRLLKAPNGQVIARTRFAPWNGDTSIITSYTFDCKKGGYQRTNVYADKAGEMTELRPDDPKATVSAEQVRRYQEYACTLAVDMMKAFP